MFDLMKTRASRVIELDIATGSTVHTEGIFMVGKLQNGVEVASLPTPAAGEKVLGYVVTDAEDHDSAPKIEALKIPKLAPFTVRCAYLPKTGTLRVWDTTANAEIVAGDSANAGEYSITDYTMTFNTAQKEHNITVSYRFDLTVEMVRQKFYQRHINRQAGMVFGKVALGCGDGELFTDAYDTSKDYSTFAPGTGLIVLADGSISVGTLAGALAVPGHVIQVPSVDSQFLGIRFSIGG